MNMHLLGVMYKQTFDLIYAFSITKCHNYTAIIIVRIIVDRKP